LARNNEAYGGIEVQEIEQALARRDLYTWLSVAFYKPEPDFSEPNFLEALLSAEEVLKYGLADEAAKLGAYLHKKEFNLEELLVEYARLFVGPSALPAPPYGSCYLEDGRVMGKSTLEVERWFQRQGLMLLPQFKDLPDHIAVEMNFMSFLSDFELAALDESDLEKAIFYRHQQEEFLTTHPLAWVQAFTTAVEKSSKLPFYPAAAAILRQALFQDERYLVNQLKGLA
jgi:putative dimethyl sulfoxide reductase chaperone